MKTIKRDIMVRKTETISVMDDGVHCAPKCKHFVTSGHCMLRAALYNCPLERMATGSRGLCLRTEFCVDTFGKRGRRCK